MLTMIHAKEEKLKRERREVGKTKVEYKIEKTKNQSFPSTFIIQYPNLKKYMLSPRNGDIRLASW